MLVGDKISGIVLPSPMSGYVSVVPAAAVVSEKDASGVKGTKVVTVSILATQTACAAAATTTDKDLGGAKGAAMVTAALPAGGAAATSSDNDFGGVQGSSNDTVPMIAALPAYATAVLKPARPGDRRRHTNAVVLRDPVGDGGAAGGATGVRRPVGVRGADDGRRGRNWEAGTGTAGPPVREGGSLPRGAPGRRARRGVRVAAVRVRGRR